MPTLGFNSLTGNLLVGNDYDFVVDHYVKLPGVVRTDFEEREVSQYPSWHVILGMPVEAQPAAKQQAHTYFRKLCWRSVDIAKQYLRSFVYGRRFAFIDLGASIIQGTAVVVRTKASGFKSHQVLHKLYTQQIDLRNAEITLRHQVLYWQFIISTEYMLDRSWTFYSLLQDKLGGVELCTYVYNYVIAQGDDEVWPTPNAYMNLPVPQRFHDAAARAAAGIVPVHDSDDDDW
jgi:hypothetical protein